MVVGPGLGGFLDGGEQGKEKPALTAATRVVNSNLDTEDDHTLRDRTPAPAPEAAEPADPSEDPITVPEEETENPDLVRYAEGTGAETGVPAEVLAGDQTQPSDVKPDHPAAPDAPEATKPETPSVRKETPREPEVKPLVEPRKIVEPKRERVVEPEKPSTRTRKPETAKEPSDSETRTERSARSEERKTERSERPRTAAAPEPERRKTGGSERTTESPKAQPEKRRTERMAASGRVDPDKRTPERVESSKPFAPREPAASETTTPEGKLFRVRVGRVTTREDAERLRNDLRDNVGIDAFLVRSGEGFRVQTGAYRARANAEKIAAELRAGSFRPEVTED